MWVIWALFLVGGRGVLTQARQKNLLCLHFLLVEKGGEIFGVEGKVYIALVGRSEA